MYRYIISPVLVRDSEIDFRISWKFILESSTSSHGIIDEGVVEMFSPNILDENSVLLFLGCPSLFWIKS